MRVLFYYVFANNQVLCHISGFMRALSERCGNAKKRRVPSIDPPRRRGRTPEEFLKVRPIPDENRIAGIMKKILAMKKPLLASLFIHCAFIAALSAGGPLMVDGPSHGPALLADDWAVEYGAVEVTTLPLEELNVPALRLHSSKLAEDGPLPSHTGLALSVEKGLAQGAGTGLRALRPAEDEASRAEPGWSKGVRGSGDHG
jgi:hypothetical protein